MEVLTELVKSAKDLLLSWRPLIIVTVFSWAILLLPSDVIEFLSIESIRGGFAPYFGACALLGTISLIISMVWVVGRRATEKYASSLLAWLLNQARYFFYERKLKKVIIPLLREFSDDEWNLLEKFRNSKEYRIAVRRGSPEQSVAEILCSKGVLDRVLQIFHTQLEWKFYQLYELDRIYLRFVMQFIGIKKHDRSFSGRNYEPSSILLRDAIGHLLDLRD